MKASLPSMALALAVALTPSAAQRVAGAPQQSPRFTSTVRMLAVNVRVVDSGGQPILGLLPADFTVSINRRDRRVVSAQLVQYSSLATAPPLVNSAPPTLARPGTVPEDSRVFVLAIDNASFTGGAIKPAMLAAQRFAANLRPSDIVGLYAYPYERPMVDLTHDHRAVQDALSRQVGRRDAQHGQYHLSPAEVIDITAGDKEVLQRVIDAECPKPIDQLADIACPGIIAAEASAAAAYYESEASQRLYGLGLLIQDLGRLPGRKTVVVVSGGLLTARRAGGRPDIQGFMGPLGAQAARANVDTYVVHLDDTYLDELSASRAPSRRAVYQTRGLMTDESAYADGLMRLATETGGTYLAVKAGSGDVVFGRVLRETMAYYLLGVEPAPEDWDGRKLIVQVKTSAKGALVRALREVIAK